MKNLLNPDLRIPTLLMAAVFITTMGVFTYAIPEHVVDPTWPDHAHHHALQSIFWIDGFCAVSLAILLTAFQKKEKWAWWLLALVVILMHGAYFIAAVVTGGGAEGIFDDFLFASLLLTYGIGLALSWKHFK